MLSKNLLKRRARLYGINFLHYYTWEDENPKYWWVFVGLMYKSARSLFPQRIAFTSKMLTLSRGYSAVNFIVGRQLFIIFLKLFAFLPHVACCQTIKLSSIQRHQTRYFFQQKNTKFYLLNNSKTKWRTAMQI